MKMKHFKKITAVFLPVCIVFAFLFTCAFSAAAEQTQPDNGVNLTVGENIVSNYHIDTAYYLSKGCDSLQYTYNSTSNQEDYVSVTSPEIELEDCGAQYVISAQQAPAQIAEPTEVTVFKDGAVYDSFSFSAKDYCDRVIAMDDDTLIDYTGRPVKLKYLCKSIIMYAKAAQEMFPEYMKKDGAVAITDDYSEDLGLSSASYTPNISMVRGSQVRFSSASFICASAAGMRFYYKPANANFNNLSVTGPEGISWEKGNGYIQINNIKSMYFDEQITVAYGDASICMGVLDYAGTVIKNTPELTALKALSQTIVAHNDTADSFFVTHTLVPVAAVNATCTKAGNIAYYRCTDTDCGQLCADADGEVEITLADTVVNALGHDYQAAVTAPTCTAQGFTTYTCTRCSDSYTTDYTDVIAHTPTTDAAVAATCTQTGLSEGSHCSVCNTVLTAQTTVPALGHNEGNTWSVKTGATLSATGTEVTTCTRCGAEMSSRTIQNFTLKLPNTADYLYRIGNANNVTLGTLFDNASGANITNVSATFTKNTGNVAGTFTANESDWRNSTIKFTGTGVVTVTLKHGTDIVTTHKFEVVAGTNYVEGATLGNVTSGNAILLGNVVVPATKTINNNKTLYGNGFTVTDTRSSTKGTSGYINMSGGGSIDNAVLLGQVYPEAITSGIDNEYYSPGVWITGNANIYNSYISECKHAVEIKEGTVVIENTTVTGGALANIEIENAKVTLKNCITGNSQRGGLLGMAVRVSNKSAKLNIEGSFTQHNWAKKADLPSNFQTILSSVYSDSNYAYSTGGSTYVNMGVMFLSDGGTIVQAEAQSCITDTTGNDYGYIQKSSGGITATVYTAKAASGASTFTAPAYAPTTNGQHPLLPTSTFDFTTKNYQAKTSGSNTYCYYDSTIDKVLISFETGSNKQWDTNILSVTKNGNSITPTVTMNSTDYTGKKITFSTEGEYDVVYTYTDPYNYNADGSAYNVVYTKTVHISVAVVTPEAVTYYAEFAYTGAAGNYAAKQVIGTDNKTYVMPDVSANVSGKIGSTTAGGKTIYYPIVTVPATGSNGNSAYSSGKGYYFAPVFSELNITDYNQSTGAVAYTYNKSATKWPHDKSSTAGPDSAIFGYASDAAYANQPFGRSMKTEYYKYGSNNNGLCYTSNDIEKDNTASTHLVQYHYVSNDGTTYYYYIQYAFGAMTYASGGCLAEGTMITMADGSKKAIEDVNVGESVMTWSFWKGELEAKPVLIKYDHGTEDYTVLNMRFSDGTVQKVITDHGFFDATLNKTVYINCENVEDYLNHTFVKRLADGTIAYVTLDSYEVKTETVGSYSIASVNNITVFANDMLTVSNEVIDNIYEYFEMGEGLKYDEAKMQADIEQYGLYTYDDFKDYISEDLYEAFNGQYYKVLVGKGLLTFDDILYMIEYYVNPYQTI
ncbi:MAG: hypothetical protein IKE65_05035 [Clostridia bacterium]|nr:hypothetical protein [Clostridia bacterium]